MGGGADSDDGEMQLSPTPRPQPPHPRSSAGGGPLPDVRALADALEAPPVVTGLQVGWVAAGWAVAGQRVLSGESSESRAAFPSGRCCSYM